jgi:hypothetical protein
MFSCEGGTTFTKIIDNKSTETVTIKTFTTIYGEQNHIIKPNEAKTIYLYDKERGFVDDTYSCIEEFDSIEFSLSNNKTLVKDILNEGNWENESSGGRNAQEKCTFSISDNDIN